MQMMLNENEILAAIRAYALQLVNISDKAQISIDLKAGRGENGYTATLDIVPIANQVEEPPIKQQPFTTRAIAETTESEKPIVAEPAPKTRGGLAGLSKSKPTGPLPGLRATVVLVDAAEEKPAEAEPEEAAGEDPMDDVLDQVVPEPDEVPDPTEDTSSDKAPAANPAPRSIFSKAR